jgi:hypothetical protein
MLALAVVVSLAAAGVWTAVGEGGFRRSLAVSLMVVAGLLALTGSTAMSRASTADVRAFLGRGLDNDEPRTGEGLTGIGVFLLVSLPLLAAGLLLFGRG